MSQELNMTGIRYWCDNDKWSGRWQVISDTITEDRW